MNVARARRIDVFWCSWTGGDVEHLALASDPDGVVAAGTMVATDDGEPFRARYRLVCDGRWRARELDVDVRSRGTDRTLALRTDGHGHWTTPAGDPLPALDGALDLDVTATPFTNTLPVRRLGLAAGEAARLPIAYVHLPALAVEPVEQRYTCLERSPDGERWRFESVDSGFTAELPVDDDGLVLDYPGLFRRLWLPPPGAPRPPLVVAFLIEDGGRLLVLRRSRAKDHAPGEWETGSGRVAPGESPLQAAVREAREETGLAVEVLGPLDTFRFRRGAAREEHEAITFHCRVTGGALRLSSEHDQAGWVPLDGAVEAPLSGDFRQSLDRLLRLRR